MNIKPLPILVLTLMLTGQSLAQSGILESYINEGLKSNLQLQREQMSLDKTFYQLNQSRSLFFPQASFNSSYTLASGGRTITIPVGDLMNPVYATLNQLTGTNQIQRLRFRQDHNPTAATITMPVVRTKGRNESNTVTNKSRRAVGRAD